jgi:hypothetical protein
MLLNLIHAALVSRMRLTPSRAFCLVIRSRDYATSTVVSEPSNLVYYVRLVQTEDWVMIIQTMLADSLNTSAWPTPLAIASLSTPLDFHEIDESECTCGNSHSIYNVVKSSNIGPDTHQTDIVPLRRVPLRRTTRIRSPSQLPAHLACTSFLAIRSIHRNSRQQVSFHNLLCRV